MLCPWEFCGEIVGGRYEGGRHGVRSRGWRSQSKKQVEEVTGWLPGACGTHHFVLVQHQPIVVGHQAEAVSPLLIVFLVLEKVPREDDAFIQGHLWAGSKSKAKKEQGVPTAINVCILTPHRVPPTHTHTIPHHHHHHYTTAATKSLASSGPPGQLHPLHR